MRYVTVDGVQLSCESHGHGAPVVLVCGTGQPASSWSTWQVPALVAAGYRAVTFDNRGKPPSDCPPAPYSVAEMVGDLAGLIEQLELAPCRLVGLSLGAFIVQELLLARPELAVAGVLMATLGRQNAFARAVFESRVELDRSGVELPPRYETLSGALVLYSTSWTADDDRVSEYLAESRRGAPWQNPGRLGQHEAVLGYDHRLEALAGIRVPCLAMGFERDLLVAPSLTVEVAQTIPGCEYVQISEAGHGGPLQCPDEVNRALLGFFGADRHGRG